MKYSAAFLSLFTATSLAILPPSLPGAKTIFSSTFQGFSGAPPDKSQWNIATGVHTNNELQTYTTSSQNVQLSGGSTLQLTPWRSSSGEWTSGRIESVQSFTPRPGGVMSVQSSLRIGTAAGKKGMWPAFWTLGDSMRHGTPWPTCGELDIFESVNGLPTGYGTAHCGDLCRDPSGRGGTTPAGQDGNFHTWTLEVDRTQAAWQAQQIRWKVDGATFFTLTGAELGDEGTWGVLAHSPLYVLLNVAVGGDWPGPPDGSTDDGWESNMEVAYVAVYQS